MVARSLPKTALTSVNRSPVSCIPSPESPANRMTTSSRSSGSSDVVSGVAVTRSLTSLCGLLCGCGFRLILPTRRRLPWTGQRPFVLPDSAERLECGERAAQGGVDPATVAGAADHLRLDVDPGADTTGPLVE